jgi:molybdate transport system substrate-binding protein
VVVVVAVAAAGCGSDGAAGAREGSSPPSITVAAASDLRFAFEELGARFEDETGTAVTFSFGSSGQLREQILNGAPFDVFASANVAFVDAVLAAGRGRPETKADYAFGRLALWTPPGVDLPAGIHELTAPTYRRIAVANPVHAPYGVAAVQALESAGILGAVEGRLVYGENISDTLRIARSGNADVGIVALSLVIADDRDHVLLPEDLHEPLRQALVVTAEGASTEAAIAFVDFVNGAEGREVMVRYGFALPGERRATG